MEYLNHTSDEVAGRTKSKRIKQIYETVKKVKASEKIGVKYMQLWEEMALAREEAKAEGRTEGKAVNFIVLICKKLKKNKSVEEIAEELETDFAIVQDICEVARPFAPEFDENKVFEAWMKRKEQ